MQRRSRSRRCCPWRPRRLPPAPRLDALSCSVGCRRASPRRARRLQAGARWIPGRDGYPNGEAAPGSYRRRGYGAGGGRRKRRNTFNQSSNTYNQRTRLRPGEPSRPCPRAQWQVGKRPIPALPANSVLIPPSDRTGALPPDLSRRRTTAQYQRSHSPVRLARLPVCTLKTRFHSARALPNS